MAQPNCKSFPYFAATTFLMEELIDSSMAVPTDNVDTQLIALPGHPASLGLQGGIVGGYASLSAFIMV